MVSLRSILNSLSPGFYLSLVLVMIIGGFWLLNDLLTWPQFTPANYQQCRQSPGSKILLTYPSQCVTKSGHNFTESAPPAPSPTQSSETAQPTATPLL